MLIVADETGPWWRRAGESTGDHLIGHPPALHRRTEPKVYFLIRVRASLCHISSLPGEGKVSRRVDALGRDEAAERSSSSSGRSAEPHPLVNRRAKRRLRLGAARRVQGARGSRQRGEGQKARGTKRRWRLAAAESAVTASGLRLCLGDSTRTFAVVAAPCWPLARSWTGSRSHLDWTPAVPGPRSYKEQEPYATDAEVPRRLCLFGGSGANGSSLPLRLAPARSCLLRLHIVRSAAVVHVVLRHAMPRHTTPCNLKPLS